MDDKIKLLSEQNTKTKKGEKLGYKTWIIYMSPYTMNSKEINVCSHASSACAKACLFGAGMGIFDNVVQGRIRKTEYFLKDRANFLKQLEKEIRLKIADAKKKGYKLAIRLNGTSDLPYEKYKLASGKNIFETFPDTQFYDYTKNYYRFEKTLPKNYHLTFSRSETNENIALQLLERGFNVAMVFDKVPSTYKGYKVINGDEDDLRFLDPKGKKGTIIGLVFKEINKGGKGKENKQEAIDSGFVILTNK